MKEKLSLHELLELALDGFRFLHDQGQLGPAELQLQKLEIVNDSTLVASVVPGACDSVGLKIEACTVIGFMSGFFEGDLALPDHIRNLGVKARTAGGEELMYVLSSLETARLCGQGRSIEWLKNSIIVENTPETRAARAKLLLSRIEVGLRMAVAMRLEIRGGPMWWASAVPQDVQAEVARTARNAPGAQTGARLLEYAYLGHLKTIVLHNWDAFHDVLTDADRFSVAMDDLNAIRRDEAHNRTISEGQAEALVVLYAYLAGAAAAVEPRAVPGYLVENWRSQLSAIVGDTAKAMPDLSAEDRRDPALVRQSFDRYAGAFRAGLERLECVVVPPGKERLHAELRECWMNLCGAINDMRTAADVRDFGQLARAAGEHDALLGRLKGFTSAYLMSELGQ